MGEPSKGGSNASIVYPTLSYVKCTKHGLLPILPFMDMGMIVVVVAVLAVVKKRRRWLLREDYHRL
jgi:hypothetical protein